MTLSEMSAPFLVAKGQVFYLEEDRVCAAPMNIDGSVNLEEGQELYATTSLPWDEELLSQEEIDALRMILRRNQ